MHSGNYAVQVDQESSNSNVKKSSKKETQTESGLVISGQLKRILSSRYFALIDFTFENKTQEWIRITDIEVDFGSEEANENISFTYGKDLSVWFKSTQKRNKIRNYNQQMALGAITGFGAGLAAGSSNSSVQNLGLMTATAGATVLSVKEFNRLKTKIEDSEIFPKNHLFAKDFIIPPGLFDKKWLVLNSKNHEQIGFLTNLYLEYKIKGEKKGKVKLQFRSPDSNLDPEWQNDIYKPTKTTKNIRGS